RIFPRKTTVDETTHGDISAPPGLYPIAAHSVSVAGGDPPGPTCRKLDGGHRALHRGLLLSPRQSTTTASHKLDADPNRPATPKNRAIPSHSPSMLFVDKVDAFQKLGHSGDLSFPGLSMVCGMENRSSITSDPSLIADKINIPEIFFHWRGNAVPGLAAVIC